MDSPFEPHPAFSVRVASMMRLGTMGAVALLFYFASGAMSLAHAAPAMSEAEKYKRALEMRERLEKALAEEFQGDWSTYDAMAQQEYPEDEVDTTSPAPVDSTKDTILLIIPEPVFAALQAQWRDTVAVSELENGWKQIFLATPDKPERRQKLAGDISAAMGRPLEIPAGTDRLLISPGP